MYVSCILVVHYQCNIGGSGGKMRQIEGIAYLTCRWMESMSLSLWAVSVFLVTKAAWGNHMDQKNWKGEINALPPSPPPRGSAEHAPFLWMMELTSTCYQWWVPFASKIAAIEVERKGQKYVSFQIWDLNQNLSKSSVSFSSFWSWMFPDSIFSHFGILGCNHIHVNLEISSFNSL